MKKNVVVSICICTYLRPRSLGRLLRSIHRLDVDTPSFEIIVVDNDNRSSARHTVAELSRPGASISYWVEPRQNIALARNRSVHAAAGEYIAFVDDDEEAESTWLLKLYRHCTNMDADGVFGPVIPRFDGQAPRWIVDGGFFDRPRLATGRPVPWYRTRTSNALIKREAIMKEEGPFDERFGLSGGEDTDLFRRMIRSGRKFVAVDDAVVYEHIASSRARSSYLISRNYRIGFIVGHFEAGAPSPTQRLWYILNNAYRAAYCAALGAMILPASRTRSMRVGLIPAARAAGRLAHAFGRHVDGYENTIGER